MVLRLPAGILPRETTCHPLADNVEDKLVSFSGASHAPLKSTERRGVTGGYYLPRLFDQNFVTTPTASEPI